MNNLKITGAFVILLLISGYVFAHEGGHGESLKHWKLIAANEEIGADFIKYDNNKVWLIDSNHNSKIYSISDFSVDDQNYIKAKSALIQSLNNPAYYRTGFPFLVSFKMDYDSFRWFYPLFFYFSIDQTKKR